MTATSSSSTNVPPLGKYLASTEKKTRDKAMSVLDALSLLPQSEDENGLPKQEMDKLWKGIFYCFWMSDKPLVQQALASELAGIVMTIPNVNMALRFLQGFWESTVREWNGIDRFRLDKYHMLVRRFLNASFTLLLRSKWDKDVCRQLTEIFTREGGPLCPTDSRVPQSLAYHLSDIYLEELDKVAQQNSNNEADEDSDAQPPPPIPVSLLLEPFFILLSQTPNTTTYKRAHSEVLEPFFSALETSQSDEEEDEDERPAKRARRTTDDEDSPFHIIANACIEDAKTEQKLGKAQLRKQLFKRLLAVASADDTRDSNRRKLYAFWKEAGIDDEDED